VIPLSNTHQVISLKLTNNNILYGRMQMKQYLLGQGVYAFFSSLLKYQESMHLPKEPW
jgi:hypothetical protein